MAIGRWLLQVKEQRLYLARFHTFYEYLEREALVSQRLAGLWIEWSLKWDQLNDQLPQDFPMPESAAQLNGLSEAPEERRGQAWVIARQRAKETGYPITKRMLSALIREHFVVLDAADKEDGNGRKVSAPRVKSIKEARVRIARLCGDKLVHNIDHGYYHVSESDLIYWANGTDEQVRYTARAIQELSWDVTRSRIAWAEKVDIDWTIRKLIAKMICQGKPMTVRANGCRITVEKE